MIKNILKSSLLILAVMQVGAQTITTPFCNSVAVLIRNELTPAEIAALNQHAQDQFPLAVLLDDASSTYNCHAYAWWVSEGGNRVWLNTPGDDAFWNDQSYVEVSSESLAEKVSYANDDHSAITTGVSTELISKWGAWPLMRHDTYDCPYNSTGIKYYSSTRTINGTINAGTYKISRQLISDGTTNSTVNFIAGESIILKQGFSASKNSSTFVAKLTSTCYPSATKSDIATMANKLKIDKQFISKENFKQLQKEKSFAMYPNPTPGPISLLGISKGAIIEIIDNSGKLIFKTIAKDNLTSFDLSKNDEGIYFIKIISESEIWNKKLIIKK